MRPKLKKPTSAALKRQRTQCNSERTHLLWRKLVSMLVYHDCEFYNAHEYTQYCLFAYDKDKDTNTITGMTPYFANSAEDVGDYLMKNKDLLKEYTIVIRKLTYLS
jgi:hypothetical protein